MKKINLLLLAMLCSIANLWAIEPENGVYQIGSAQDFKEFAAIVNASGTGGTRSG